MKLKAHFAFAAASLLLAAGPARADTITFETLSVGTVVSNQFAGVIFSPNAFSGAGSSSSGENWATNTDLTVVSSTSADVGGLGVPSLVSGNILHSFGGWVNEDGDPSFRISFAAPINSFAATFAGVNVAADVTIWAFNGPVQVGIVSGSTTGQFTLSLAATTITSVVVRPGSFVDWVGVDNITYTPATSVPEASTYAMMALGLALLAFKRRAR